MTSPGQPLVGDEQARKVHGWSGRADLALLGDAGGGDAGDGTVHAAVVEAGASGTLLRCTGTLADALARLADLCAAEDGRALVVAAADLDLTLPAVLDLLDRPGVLTGAICADPLTLAGGREQASRARVGADGKAVESVASGVHQVSRPTHVLPGVLRIDPADRPRAAALWRVAAADAEPAWGDDAFAVCVLALVRGGVRVQAVPLGPFAWARGPVRAQGASGGPWQQRLRGASRGGDGLFSTFVVRPLSRRVTRFGLDRGWSPNGVTFVSLGLGLLAAALVLTDDRWAWVGAAVLVQLALVVDCVDGELARFTRRFGAFGAWLDGVGDRVKEYAVLAALGAVAVRHGDGGWVVAITAMALVTFRHLEDYTYFDRLRPLRASRPVILPMQEPGDGADPAERRTFASPPSARSRVVHWAKKVVHLPIAERYLLISLGLLTFRPMLVLWVLLAAVTMALVWTQAGRTAKALLRRDGIAGVPVPEGTGWGHLDHQLDLGPLARLAGRAVRLPLPLALAVLLLAGAAYAVAAWRGEPAVGLAAAVVVAVVVGAGARPPVQHRLAWQLPALLWLAEAVLLAALAVTGLAPGQAGAAFAYLAVVAYHRYDVVYRLRETSTPGAPWLSLFGLGADGRMVLLTAVALWLPQGQAVVVWLLTGLLAVMFAGESTSGWRRWSGATRAAHTALVGARP